MQEKLPDYTSEEICTIYRNQKDRSRGVKILMQLTGWSKEKIEQILIDRGYTLKHKKVYKCVIQYEEALELYKKNWTDKEIANYFGVNPYSVKQWRKRHGLVQPKDLKKTQESINESIELYLKGFKISEIATKQQLSRNCISKRITRWKNENN